MRYTSTRDATRFYTFEEALFSGYAPDGGLFVPEVLPDVLGTSSGDSAGEKSSVLSELWPKLGYVAMATEILHPFIGDEGIPKEELRSLLEGALEGFDDVGADQTPPVPVVPMVRKRNASNGVDQKQTDCYVAELFHGPTYCFKVSVAAAAAAATL